jgi:hypothetical protein
MVNKRGYSLGIEHPIHYEQRWKKWVVFNAMTDKDIAEFSNSWEAMSRCVIENEKAGYGCRPDIMSLDATP